MAWGMNFILLYFISLILGNLLALYYHRQNPLLYRSRCKWGHYGVVYSCILMFPDMKLAFIFFPVPMPAYVFGVGYLIYTLFGMRAQRDSIGHTAHFGGALGGILPVMVFDPFVFQKSLFTLVLLVVVTVVAGFILFRKQGF